MESFGKTAQAQPQRHTELPLTWKCSTRFLHVPKTTSREVLAQTARISFVFEQCRLSHLATLRCASESAGFHNGKFCLRMRGVTAYETCDSYVFFRTLLMIATGCLVRSLRGYCCARIASFIHRASPLGGVNRLINLLCNNCNMRRSALPPVVSIRPSADAEKTPCSTHGTFEQCPIFGFLF